MATTYQEFDAQAFHPDLGPEAIEGAIFFSSHALTFRGGETLIRIPLHQLLTEFENGGQGRIILRDSGQSGWTIVTSDLSVLELRSVPVIVQLAEQVQSRLAGRELSRRARLVFIFFAGCGLALWLGMLALGAMVRSIVARVPPEVEKQYGKDILGELKLHLEFGNDTNQAAELAATVEPLLNTLKIKQDWQFYVVKDDSLNAFAVPGGYILVTSGLLSGTERPEELLGVIAHELAHVTHKHGFRQQISSAGPLLVFQVFLRGRSGALAAAAGGSALLVHQSFSQEYEKEADDAGWDYLVAANIDPRGMIEMFRKLKTAEGRSKHADLLPKAFHSHPDLDKRIARLQAKWKRLPRKSGFLELDDNR